MVPSIKKFTNFDDISSADIYQVTTYCLLHNYKRAILLYPQYDKKVPDICDYQLNCAENNYHIDFCTVNLKNNDLKDKEVQNSIIAKIKSIIGN